MRVISKRSGSLNDSLSCCRQDQVIRLQEGGKRIGDDATRRSAKVFILLDDYSLCVSCEVLRQEALMPAMIIDSASEI
jgi:hypothetical protein